MKTSTKILFVCLMLLVLVPSQALAQTNRGGIIPECGQRNNSGGLNQECGFDDFVTLINNIIRELIKYAVPVSAGVFAWAGLNMMLNPDNSGKRSESIAMMKKVGIGLAIILSAWLVTEAIVGALFKGDYTNIINK